MAVVSTTDFGFGGRKYKKVVRCNRDGIFRCKLPHEIPDRLGCDEEVTGETLDIMERQFRIKLDEYEKAQTTCSKVILYDIEITAKIEAPRAEGVDPDIYHLTIDLDDLGFAKGIAVAVHAGVFTEEATVRGEQTVYKYVEVENSIPRSMKQHGKFSHNGACEFETVGLYGTRAENVIPWTEQREAFFRDLGRAMEQLVMQLHEFMGVPKKLMQLMDSGRRFLPPPP